MARQLSWRQLACVTLVVALCPLASAGASSAATSGTWSATGSLTTAREQQTATVLRSGNVLVAGGLNCTASPCTVYNSTELYVPSTGAWKPAGSMASARFGQVASPLSNGLVLVAGGCGASADGVHCTSVLSSAELFNPRTGKWTATGSMTTARFGATATLFVSGPLSGTVLVAGGYNTSNFFGLSSAELFNPRTGKWTATGSMTAPRFGHTATMLANGQVLAAGGCCDSSGNSVDSAEVFNPATASWTATGGMTEHRYYHTATLLTTGQVLVTGGLGSCAYGCPILNSAELYDPTTNAWSATGAMNSTRYLHAAVRLSSGKVLVVGGSNSYGGSPLASAELFDPTTNAFTLTGSMATARAENPMVLMRGSRALVAGGCSNSNCTVATNTAEWYQP